ncbi:MAG: SseB family protein [Butyrivibrio sp.]|nr:SseB family protein [Butyrivibrio sp.]
MGLFDIFGKKNDKEAEQEKEKALEEQKEKTIEDRKKVYEGLEWPCIQRLNPVNIKDAEGEVMEETVPPERKDEIGEMIYDEDISPDTLKFLSGQELLFLLTALEVFNKKAPLPGFEKNHRKVYNEVLGRVRDADTLFVLYDRTTGYPYIDHGFTNVYFEKELAEKAVEMFDRQYRKLFAKECKVENNDAQGARRAGFFDYLYYIGMENLIVDNGAYRARFKRNEIVAAPGDWNRDERDKSPVNPALNFAMLDFIEEARWPVKYEKRNEVLRAKEIRMLSLVRSAHFIVPMQHEGPAELMEDGRVRFGKDTKIRFLVMKTQDDKQFIPLYTDGFEFAKIGKGKEWNAGVFGYQDILRFVQDKDGIRINPDGQGIVITKQQMMALEMAGHQADLIRGRQMSRANTGQSADNAVQQALGQAVARMQAQNDDNKEQQD